MTFAQRRNRLTTHFSGCFLVVKRCVSLLTSQLIDRYSCTISSITHSIERFPYWESAGSSASQIHRIVWNVTVYCLVHSSGFSLSWAKWRHSTPFDHTSVWFILILCSHLLLGLTVCFRFSHQKPASVAFVYHTLHILRPFRSSRFDPTNRIIRVIKWY